VLIVIWQQGTGKQLKIATVKELCEVIWEAERRFDLLSWKVNGVHLWQAKRMAFYYSLAQKACVLELPQRKPISGYLDRLKMWASLLRGAVLYNPLVGGEQLGALIFETQRHQQVGGENLDIFTCHLAQDLGEKEISFHLLDRFYNGRHRKQRHSSRRYLDYMDLKVAIGTRIGRCQVPEADTRKIEEIESYFEKEIGVYANLFDNHQRALHRFLLRYEFFRHLFKLREPKEIYCVDSFSGLAPMIKAAKEMALPVIELQHGTFSKYHLGYSFPDWPQGKQLPYFPNKFYVWNKYWKDKIQLPIDNDNVVCYGNKFFDQQKSKYGEIEKKKGQIVVISQGVIGGRLSSLILEHAGKLSSHKIVYKLHPGEYDRWRDYESLVVLSKMENVEIATECDLYRVFAQSEYQIGVFSTAIYEGMAFGVKTVLAQLPGIEYMEDMLKDNTAITFDQFIENL
jgi:hypothetical protein